MSTNCVNAAQMLCHACSAILPECESCSHVSLVSPVLALTHSHALSVRLTAMRGSPQAIARKGRYGSFLLEETDLLYDIVSTLHRKLRVPVTCKIRLVTNPDPNTR